MDATQLYLSRYANSKTLFSSIPNQDLNLVVVIPCFNEEKLFDSLNALNNCLPTIKSCEVIVIINDGQHHNSAIKKQNKTVYLEAIQWAKLNNSQHRNYLIHYESNLNAKHAGVGWARKIGMDEAIRRMGAVNNQGIIVCFDADSICQTNYLLAIENHFNKNPETPGASIHYEHPLSGDFSSQHYEGIIYYELFLRYYINALRYAQFPFAYHTIGSSMAVRSEIYTKQGGMNRRKAGEDFYFLQKVIPLGNYTEINNTTVIPSPRDSNRVPFGTGKAVKSWLNHEKELSAFYNPKIFMELKIFLESISQIFESKHNNPTGFVHELPGAIHSFLLDQQVETEVKNILKHCGPTFLGFKNRFFQWFDAFKILKFVHYARDNHHHNVEAAEAITWLMKNRFNQENEINSLEEILLTIRTLDKMGWKVK